MVEDSNVIISQWKLTISLVSPFLTQGYTGQFGIDTVAARNHQGKVYIPGTLLKGVFRSVLASYSSRKQEELGEMQCLHDAAQKMQQWLGVGSDENISQQDTNEPYRGNVNFADLLCLCEESRERKTLYRISVDDFTGAVRQGAYQVIELTFPAGEIISFEGIVRFQGTAQDARLFEQVLKAAWTRVPAIGGFKSLGFGRINGVNIEALSNDIQESPVQGEVSAQNFDDSGYISVKMSFDRPIVMSAERVTDNLFRGAIVFPGSVLKGALAEKIELAGKSDELAAIMSEVRFFHAYPVEKEDQKLKNIQPILPYSLYVTQKNKTVFGDYFIDKEQRAQAMSEEMLFQNDWKGESFEVANTALGGSGGPDFEMRTRTKIDYDTQIAYDDEEGGKLFSYQAVVAHKHDWICDLYLPPSCSFSPKQKQDFLAFLSSHIFQMGKSKAYCEISLFNNPRNTSYDPSKDVILMTLKTDALLLDIHELRETDNIGKLYKEYFAILGLELLDYMACQKMSGGYLGMRYGEKSQYTPWLLTEKGSVFQLKPKPENDMNRLIHQGLPVMVNYSNKWSEMPFVPQNGYGEISLDLNRSFVAQLNQKSNEKGV